MTADLLVLWLTDWTSQGIINTLIFPTTLVLVSVVWWSGAPHAFRGPRFESCPRLESWDSKNLSWRDVSLAWQVLLTTCDVSGRLCAPSCDFLVVSSFYLFFFTMGSIFNAQEKKFWIVRKKKHANSSIKRRWASVVPLSGLNGIFFFRSLVPGKIKKKSSGEKAL